MEYNFDIIEACDFAFNHTIINGKSEPCNERNYKVLTSIIGLFYCNLSNRELIGRRYGKLTVKMCMGLGVERSKKSGIVRKDPYYLCQCDCGNLRIIARRHLGAPDISCTCAYDESAKKRGEYLKAHPEEATSYKHGGTDTRLYRIYIGMKERCNPNSSKFSKWYEGLDVCDEWADPENGFINFKKWALEEADPPYDDSLSIDRIDNKKGYSPDNCRWATKFEQTNNRGTNVYITYGYFSFPLGVWAKIIGIKYEWANAYRHSTKKRTDKELIEFMLRRVGKSPLDIIEIPEEYIKFNKYYDLHPEMR